MLSRAIQHAVEEKMQASRHLCSVGLSANPCCLHHVKVYVESALVMMTDSYLLTLRCADNMIDAYSREKLTTPKMYIFVFYCVTNKCQETILSLLFLPST